MTDVRLYHVPDGGEIECINGKATMSDGLETAVYLSLFGGNIDDSGLDGDARRQWWGNWSETDEAKHYRSETQHLLKSLPLIPASLRRVEDAAKRDLEWMVPDPASAVEATANIPNLNTIKLHVVVTVDGKRFPYEFTEFGTRRGV